jgi:threonyl-tRNA synthetase
MSISAKSQNIKQDTIRHSFAHLMAASVMDMFPDASCGIGPVVENGCYYDFVLPRTLVPEDLEILTEKIKTNLKRDLVYKQEFLSYDEAFNLFLKRDQGLKCELIRDLETKHNQLDETEDFAISKEGKNGVIIWRIVDQNTGEMIFEDLCKGPHVQNFEELRNCGFALDKFSAAYWRGDQANQSMQRLYALVFQTPKELEQFIFVRQEAKKRDHRTLNITQKYFTISDLVGAGLPLFAPNGALIRQLITDYLWQLHKNLGYKRVWTPHIAKIELYETSGHAAKFGDELFKVKGKSGDFIMKPMNCPHHMQIFADNHFSYKDMPVRYFEPATIYRDENPGQLSGLTRVRAVTQDDGHLFCTVDQIQEEASSIVSIISAFYETMQMENSWVRLSVRDMQNKSAYLGTDEVWNTAEKALEDAAITSKLNYKRVEGEAAFYGPKLDFMFKDCLSREWQLATIQCDFMLPERFDLAYTDQNGDKARPVVIHRAISGSLERFMAVMIDNFGGRLPFWLAPLQLKILTINDTVLDYVAKIEEILEATVLEKPLKYNELRYEVDNRAESLGKKIREAEIDKIPVIIIVGPKDKEANQVSIRTQTGEQKINLAELDQFLKSL